MSAWDNKKVISEHDNYTVLITLGIYYETWLICVFLSVIKQITTFHDVSNAVRSLKNVYMLLEKLNFWED